MLLAIDSSTDTAGLALVAKGELLFEITWLCGRNHTRQLLPNLARLFHQTGVATSALAGIVVALGPGSFNGLRVGVNTAKGLAFALDIPIVGVGSLEATAYQYAATGLPVTAIFGAGRGEIATATYRLRRNQWSSLAAECLTTIDRLAGETTEKTLFCGDLADVAATLKERLGARAVLPSPTTGLRRAAFLAELGLKRLQIGDVDNTATLQPVYLRRPNITPAKHR
jgi:tRNA threonylcarbamoyl adenosine modification protein YeaZ